MPDVAIKHKNSKVGQAVYSFPEGVSEDEMKAAVAAFGDGGWSIDKKTDPADVPVAADSLPAQPDTTK